MATSGGRSVGIVRPRTQATEFACLFVCLFDVINRGILWRVRIPRASDQNQEQDKGEAIPVIGLGGL
jgi:hypothetical protein